MVLVLLFMPHSLFNKKNLTTFLLSTVSGFTDILGFIGFGLFTAHITGNLALASVAIIQNQSNQILSRIIIVPVFILGVTLATGLADYFKDKRKRLIILLTMEAFFLIVFMLTGIYTQLNVTRYDEKMIILLSTPAVLAMGIQNSIRKDLVLNIYPTAVMTSNLTLFIIHLSKYIKLKIGKNTDPDLKINENLYVIIDLTPILVGFLSGGIAAGLCMPFFHYWSIIIPIIVVAALIYIHI